MSARKPLVAVIAPKAFERADGGLYWSGIVTVDGLPVCVVENEGRGGCCRFMVKPETKAQALWREVETMAKQKHRRHFEPVDAFVGELWDTAFLAVRS